MSNTPNCSDVISRIFVMCGLSLAIIGCAQYFRIAFIFWEARPIPYGTISNKNLYASALYLTIPFIWYQAAISKRIWKQMSSAGMVIVTSVIILCKTRAVWLALAVALLSTPLILLVLLKLKKANAVMLGQLLKRMRGGAVLMAIGIAMGIATVALVDSSLSVDHDKPMNVTDPRSFRERLILWERSIHMITDHPLLGVGGGNWKVVFPSYGLDGLRGETGDVFFQRPHNDFIWVLSENGPPGLALYVLIFCSAIYYCCLAVRKASSVAHGTLAVLLIFGITGFLVFSLFSFPRERIIHLVFMAMILSSAIVLYHGSHPISVSVKRPVLYFLAAIAYLLVIASIYIGTIRLYSDVHTKRAVAAGHAGRWKTAISEIETGYFPLAGLDPASTPPIWYKGFAQLSLNNIEGAFDSFQRALRANPYHIKVLDNLATCYELRGEHKMAIEYYKKALAILPGFEKTSLNLAAAYYNAGLYEEAQATLQRIKGEPNDDRYDEFKELIEKKLTGEPAIDSGNQLFNH